MVAGIDRYFQIARCLRDEDLRGDRQPEFTQLDLEMSFVDEGAVMDFVERMIIEVSRATVPDRPIQDDPFPRFTYDEAMDRFGSDKPDIRFGMELVDLGPRLVDPSGAPASGFRVFDETLASGGRVKAIVAPGMAGLTRREIDELTERAKRFGAKGLAYLALEAGGEIKGPIAKFLSEELTRSIVDETGANEGDLILVVADKADVVAEVLGRLRVELGGRLGLADPDVLAYCWVHRFPMYKWDPDGGRWDATHNPFSGVVPDDEDLLVTASGDPAKPSPDDPAGRARAIQYDVVLNGWELGGGSIRIWRRDLLERSFGLQGYSLEQMRERFGAVLEAFDYGPPPHGGIAIGIDRWAALFSRQTNIREVMAFPKTQSGADLMLDAPSPPDPEQLAELGLGFVGRSPGTRGRDGRFGQLQTARDHGPARAPRGDREPAPARGPARRDVHRVLGHLLPLGRSDADDRNRVPLPVRAAGARRRRVPGAAALRSAAGPNDRARPRRRGVLRRRPHVVAPRDRVRRGRPRDGPRQPPGPRRRPRGVGAVR